MSRFVAGGVFIWRRRHICRPSENSSFVGRFGKRQCDGAGGTRSHRVYTIKPCLGFQVESTEPDAERSPGVHLKGVYG